MWRLCCVFLGFAFSVSAQAEEEMQTRVFRVREAAAGFDPFADWRPGRGDFSLAGNAPPMDVRKVLEDGGVGFPAGAEAMLNPEARLLMVTNTAANLELTRAFVEETSPPPPPTIAFVVTAVEGPAGLIRQAEAAALQAGDASKELNLLLSYANHEGSNVRAIGDCFIEAPSGIRTSTEVGKQAENTGLKLVVEPTLASDGKGIESRLELDLPGAPFAAKLSALSGETRLVGVTRPEKAAKEKEGVLWAVFVTATVRRTPGEEMVPRPAVIEDADAAAAGLETVVFRVPDGLLEAAGDVPFALQPWLTRQGITFDKGAKVSHKDGVLRMTNTWRNIGRTTMLVEKLLGGALKTAAFTVHTFQAPAALLRGLAQHTARRTDDSTMLATVQAAAEKGQARCVDFVFLDSKPGAKSQWQAGHDWGHVSSVNHDSAGRLRLEFGARFVGTRLRVETVASPYRPRLEVEVSHEIHPAGADEKAVQVIDPATKEPRDIPAMNYQAAKTRRNLRLLPGDTRLLTLHEPVGCAVPGMLWATFLRCNVAPCIPPPAPVPSVEKKDAGPATDPLAWETRSFRVPRDFLSTCCAPGQDRPRTTARDILVVQGIPFPAGATAFYTPGTSRLRVRNTRENLGMVDEYVKTIVSLHYSNFVMSAQILQGPGTLLRRVVASAAGRGDHRAALEELLAAVKAGTARHVNTTHIVTTPWELARSEQTTQHPHLECVSGDEQGDTFFEQGKRWAGWSLAMETGIGADGRTVQLHLNSDFHTTAPQEHQENVIDAGRLLKFPLADYHFQKMEAFLSIPPGTARLVSVWKPTGKPEFEKEEVLQVMFITCDELRLEK